MPIIRVHNEESEDIYPGDVVFHWQGDNTARYPLHAGIYVGDPQAVDKDSSLLVVGIPSGTLQYGVGAATWGGSDASCHYNVSIVGARRDQDGLDLHDVARLALAYTLDLPRGSEPCAYGKTFLVKEDDRGKIRFVAGSCAHFVNFVYMQADLPLVRYHLVKANDKWTAEFEMRDPDNPKRVYPACLIRAFSCDTYPIQEEWQAAFRCYPDCLEPACPRLSAMG